MQTHYAVRLAAAATSGVVNVVSDKQLQKLRIQQVLLGTSVAATSATSYALRCSISNNVLAIINVGTGSPAIIKSEHAINLYPGVYGVDFWLEDLASLGSRAAVPANYSLSVFFSVA